MWTTRRIMLDPGAPSIIPGGAEMLFQIRDDDPAVIARLENLLRTMADEVTATGPRSVTFNWSGERGLALFLAPSERQAANVFRYACAVIDHSPALRGLVIGRTQETLTLSCGTDLEVQPASWRRSRGGKAIAIVLDECAFFHRADDSANGDQEILTALKPSLATTGGPMLLTSSWVATDFWLALRSCRDHPLNHTGSNTKGTADLQDAHALRFKLAYARLYGILHRAPTELRPLRFGPRQTGVDPFTDDAALKLCKHAEHLEHRLASSRRRVEPLLVQEQIDALVMQFLQDAEQIPSAIGLAGRPTRPRPCRTLSRSPP